MANSKTTKRALLTSALAILACVAMLMGATFAWFTDAASTGVNKIVSGNLKVELTYKNKDTKGDFALADKNTPIFYEEALWEPGYVEYAVLNVRNAGSLALKYKLGINIAAETGSTNTAGTDFKLSDYIRFAVLTDDQSALTRAELVEAATAAENWQLNAGYTVEEHLLAGDTDNEKTVTLVLWMPTSVGNEANHKTGVEAPSIELGVNVVATQDTVEHDSFDKDYDQDALYPTADTTEAINAIKNGGSVLFGQDVQTPEKLNMTKDTDISLGGQTWTVGDNTKLADGAKLTVSGGKVLGKTFASYVDVRPGTTTDGVVTYTNVDFVSQYNAGRRTIGSSTTHTDYILKHTPEAGGHTKLVFKNCTFTNSALKFDGLSGKIGSFEVVFENCTFEALTNNELIEVNSSYVTNDSTITIKDCTFNVTATSNFSVIDRAPILKFEGSNTFNAVVATPTGADKKGTAEEIKIFSENLNVKVCSAKKVSGLETVTVSGVIKK